MKRAKGYAFWMLLFLLSCSVVVSTQKGDGSAHGSTLSGPYSIIPHICFKGLFASEHGDMKDMGHHNRLLFSILGTERPFLVREVVNLTGTGRGFGVLARMKSNRVEFVGPEAFLEQLNSPAVSGRPLVIKGRLYFSSGRLLVTSVNIEPEEPVSH